MSNPVLNEKAFKQAATDDRVGWAAPETATVWHEPASDGPISPYRTGRMTVEGAITATGVLFVLLLVGGVVGWLSVKIDTENLRIPGWIFAPLLIGLGLVIWSVVKPQVSRYTAPAYALCEGLLLGAISHVFDTQWHGIAAEAALGTAGVFATMLVLYTTRIVKVTDRFRKMVIAATVGVMVIYAVGLLARLFGGGIGFINSPSAFGILFSVVVVGVAAFNLMLDFDLIEKGAAAGAPKYMEWYAALGLMVTVVWLYLEILRLLAKLRQR